MELFEMLELAAHAAGYKTVTCNKDGLCLVSDNSDWNVKPNEWQQWDPLNNDGDAFNLVMKLKLSINFREYDVNMGQTHVATITDVVVGRRNNNVYEPYINDSDLPAVLRKAIVHAAALVALKMNRCGDQ